MSSNMWIKQQLLKDWWNPLSLNWKTNKYIERFQLKQTLYCWKNITIISQMNTIGFTSFGSLKSDQWGRKSFGTAVGQANKGRDLLGFFALSPSLPHTKLRQIFPVCLCEKFGRSNKFVELLVKTMLVLLKCVHKVSPSFSHTQH
jgi:hypothetical protein